MPATSPAYFERGVTRGRVSWLLSQVRGSRVLFLGFTEEQEVAMVGELLCAEGMQVTAICERWQSSNGESKRRLPGLAVDVQSASVQFLSVSPAALNSGYGTYSTIILDHSIVLAMGPKAALETCKTLLVPGGTVLAALDFARLSPEESSLVDDDPLLVDFFVAFATNYSLTAADFIETELCCVAQLRPAAELARPPGASFDVTRYLEFGLRLISRRYWQEKHSVQATAERLVRLIEIIESTMGIRADFPIGQSSVELSELEQRLHGASLAARRLAFESSFSKQGLQALSRWTQTQVLDLSDGNAQPGHNADLVTDLRSPPARDMNALLAERDRLSRELARAKLLNQHLKRDLVTLHGSTVIKIPQAVKMKRLVKRLTGRYPYSPVQSEVEVTSRVQAGKVAEAITWIHQALELRLADAESLYRIGYDALKQIDLAAAVEFGTRALELNPANAALREDLVKKQRRLITVEGTN